MTFQPKNRRGIRQDIEGVVSNGVDDDDDDHSAGRIASVKAE